MNAETNVIASSTITEKSFDGFGFIVKIVKVEEWGVTFEIDKLDTSDLDEPPITPFIEGSIKWDGCSNFTFVKSYHHFCKTDHFVLMNRAIQLAIEESKSLFTSNIKGICDMEPWDLKEEDINIRPGIHVPTYDPIEIDIEAVIDAADGVIEKYKDRW